MPTLDAILADERDRIAFVELRQAMRRPIAMTVSAETGDGTRPELDLAELPGAPMAFRMR